MSLSRRAFLGQISAASLLSLPIPLTGLGELFGKALSKGDLPQAFPGDWKMFGRCVPKRSGDSIILQDGFVASSETWKDCEFSFRARAPKGTEQVQIWAGLRTADRDSRYIFGLRGGNNDDLYFARYAPDGGARFLGIAPLDFHPVPDTWYQLRAIVRGNRFQLYINDEAVPRINVVDPEPLWSEGGISLGGGWLPAEFRDVHAQSPGADSATSFDAVGDRVWQPASFDREQRRAEQRARHAGVKVAAFDSVRAEYSLDGKWLFLPDYQAPPGSTPQAPDYDDQKWHVMEVPAFWTPTLSWLHAETGFPNFKGLSSSKGICDKLYDKELKRLSSYTFNWEQTKGAWYRQYVDMPADLSGRRFELSFDAIAKVADVWVNGTKVGSHVGMFGEVKCDITAAAKPGRNVVAVHVRSQLDQPRSGNEVMGVAVTVEVTKSMLYSLPHGMYPEEASGIWQPAKLIVTRTIAADDVFIKPRLDGFDCELTIRNSAAGKQAIEVSYVVRSASDGDVLYSSSAAEREKLQTSGGVLHFSTPVLKPRLWSPWEPNLYHLEITLTSEGEVFDRVSVPFGFRTFRTQGEKLLLNGKPFWLRGANHFPNALRPNDDRLARRFMKLAKEGNVCVTRSHTAPFTETWIKAADEAGMLVSYEGSWPWLMLEGEPPSEEFLRYWKDEFAAIIRKLRNHPSIILWTVNNEMKFPILETEPDRLKRKWVVLDGMMKEIRSIDPTRPIVCDSSYSRQETAKRYEELVRPKGFDDGDIDDIHAYYGWYNPSFFHFFKGEFARRAWPNRPMISQEMSTGYPRNDDGHPTRFYLFKHYTPQSLVGDEAWEHRDPAIFLKRQAFMTKELAETFRRANRETCAGILHFAYVSWFKDVWNADTIQPFETYERLKLALQPVLVSAELDGRHFYAGTTPRFRVCIVNDAENCLPLPPARLVYEVSCAGKVMASGSAQVPSIPYYANRWFEMAMQLPASLPSPRVDARLTLRLESEGHLLSINDYEITLGTRPWALEGMFSAKSTVVYDPHGRAPELLKSAQIRSITALDSIDQAQAVIVAGAENSLSNSKDVATLRSFVERGGRVLLLGAGRRLPEVFPDMVKSYRPCEGEIVTMHVPESPVFDGIEPLDLSWFEQGSGEVPRACRGCYEIDRSHRGVTELACVVDTHAYLKTAEQVSKISGSPLVELRIGKGIMLVSEMALDASANDPIAGRLLGNLIRALG